MGVPKFAAWLSKKFPAMVIESCPDDVHGLYIDLNGLIHPCCHDEEDTTVALRTEAEKLRSICLAIETLVVTVKPRRVVYIAIDGVAPRAKMNQQRARRYMSAATPLTNTAKPSHGVGGGNEISAEVVAAIEKEFTEAERSGAAEDLEAVNQALLGDVLYGGADDDTATPAVLGEGAFASQVPTQPAALPPFAGVTTTHADATAERFDSNCISPGTAFMDKVAAAVRDFVARKLSAADGGAPSDGVAHVSGNGSGGSCSDDPLTSSPTSASTLPPPSPPASSSPWANVTVVFSDSNTAGEGEHKILDFLRTQSAFPGFNGTGCHVIAGLDADLIFLSLSLHIPRVIILRDHDRSSYDKALLSVSAGGTLTSKKKKKATTKAAAAAATALKSISTSSMVSAMAAAVAETTETTEATEISVTPPPSDRDAVATPNSYGGDLALEENGGEDDCLFMSDADDEVGDSPASPSPSTSPQAAPVTQPPPHIATVAADVCTTYEYYDVDVIGASLVSEIYQLCLEKGMEVKGNPLENAANGVATNGFRFHRVGATTATTTAPAEKTTETRQKAASPAAAPLPAFHPCTSSSNSKIIDDFIVLGMLLGNDFLPHSPSAYCGESAMDTLLDVYVSAVLPHGYLTGGLYEIQLLQLERLFRAYAAVEAVRFRQQAIQAGLMTPQEAATATLCSAADRRCWRDTYIRTTSLKDEAGVQAACRAYVEGIRFVWRYYSSISQQVSWSWYYPFHHAPFAYDVAQFLRAQGPNVQATLAAPKLERMPPPPFCQLLCILPPTSRLLVPAALRPSMTAPPPELVDTFPTTWTVDFTGAYGKDHLAAVLLPFANLPDLQALVTVHADTYTAEERARNALRSTHLVLERRVNVQAAVASHTTDVDATGKADPSNKAKGKRGAAAAAKAGGFLIQGDGLQPLAAADLPPELQNYPSIVCSSLADVMPPLTRPRTYSHTVPIPGLTVLPDGTRVPVERRPQGRYRNRRRRDDAVREGKSSTVDGGSAAGTAASVAAHTHTERPPMLFGEFAVALVIVGLLTATVTVRRSTSFVGSLQLVLQLCGIALMVLGAMFALGLAMANKGRPLGSGMHRHNIFTAFVDWQCASCLSLNFSRNRRCFVCRAPFDPHRCVALFSGRAPAEPPLMDPDHAAYAASYRILSL
jgi:5'-3' exoribonuclease 2